MADHLRRIIYFADIVMVMYKKRSDEVIFVDAQVDLAQKTFPLMQLRAAHGYVCRQLWSTWKTPGLLLPTTITA